MECELPLLGATQAKHNWWTKGLVGSRRTRRNWTEGWTTAKSVAQEGRKVKRILPTLPSHSIDRTTSRTNLTGLKPAEDFFLFFSFFLSSFPPEFLLPFCPSFFFYSFFLPSFTFLLLLTAFFYLLFGFNFCQNTFLSCLRSSLFLLPSFLSFSIPFFPPSLLLLFSPFSFSHRWDNKACSTEKTRVRPY